jgi:hypothetical protein
MTDAGGGGFSGSGKVWCHRWSAPRNSTLLVVLVPRRNRRQSRVQLCCLSFSRTVVKSLLVVMKKPIKELTEDIKKSIKDLMAAEPKTRQEAGNFLLDQSSDLHGLNALVRADFESECEELLRDPEDAERQIVATCVLHLACFRAIGKATFDGETLRDSRRNFGNLKVEKKKKVLKAVWLFANANANNAALVQRTGWADGAVSRKEEALYGHEILLLDVLKDRIDLAGLMTGANDTKAMLKFVISKGSNPERSAGLRVASCVVKAWEQSLAGGPLQPGDIATWLEGAHIVNALADCITASPEDAAVESAVLLLSQLSNQEAFLVGIRGKRVLNALVAQVLTRERCLNLVFDLLRRILASKKAADVFTTNDGPSICLKLLAKDGVEDAVSTGILSVLAEWLDHASSPKAGDAFTACDGLKACLPFLSKADRGVVKDVLDLLMVWSNKCTDSSSAFQDGLVLPTLMSLLSAEDPDIAQAGCVLVSWALHHECRNDLGFRSFLKDEATKYLLPFLAECPEDAGYAIGGLEGLIKTVVHDEESGARFPAVDFVDRLLKPLRDGCPDDKTLEAVLRCLMRLTRHKTGFADLLVSKGVAGFLVRRLKTEDITKETQGHNFMLLDHVNRFLSAAQSSQIPELDITALPTLLKVSALPDISSADAPRYLLILPLHI